jgi:23S rRNA pseudouridine2605 synthase
MLHKPVGVVSTADDPHGRQTVVEMLDLPERVFPVGRLDANSEGLLLLTNDGALTHHLTHPRFEIDKEYHVLLDGYPQERILQQWRAGVVLEGTRTAPATVERPPLREVEAGRAAGRRMERGAWMRVVIHEGRKRHIREVAKLLGHQVKRLIRVREGTLVLGDLAPGKWRFLTPDEIATLHSHTSHANLST